MYGRRKDKWKRMVEKREINKHGRKKKNRQAW